MPPITAGTIAKPQQKASSDSANEAFYTFPHADTSATTDPIDEAEKIGIVIFDVSDIRPDTVCRHIHIGTDPDARSETADSVDGINSSPVTLADIYPNNKMRPGLANDITDAISETVDSIVGINSGPVTPPHAFRDNNMSTDLAKDITDVISETVDTCSIVAMNGSALTTPHVSPTVTTSPAPVDDRSSTMDNTIIGMNEGVFNRAFIVSHSKKFPRVLLGSVLVGTVIGICIAVALALL